MQPEQHPVRGTWRWVPAPTEGWPWGNPSVNGRCGWTRTTGVVGFHPEMSVRGSVRGTWRWDLPHVENRPWGNLSVGVRLGISGWIVGVDLASLRSTQSGEPDAGCQLSPRVDHGGTHRSTLDVAGPGGPVSGRSRRYVSVGRHLAPPGATPSQGNLTLGVRSHRESTMGEPIDRRSVQSHPDRRSSWTAPSRCSDPPYIPFAKGGGSCARGSAAGGGTHVSRGGGSTPPNAAVGVRWRSTRIRFVTSS